MSSAMDGASARERARAREMSRERGCDRIPLLLLRDRLVPALLAKRFWWAGPTGLCISRKVSTFRALPSHFNHSAGLVSIHLALPLPRGDWHRESPSTRSPPEGASDSESAADPLCFGSVLRVGGAALHDAASVSAAFCGASLHRSADVARDAVMMRPLLLAQRVVGMRMSGRSASPPESVRRAHSG